MRRRQHWDRDDETFSAEAYNWDGIAVVVLGWETALDEDTEWSGYEVRTGRIVVRMIGDHERHVVDVSDVTPIAREDYCGECGQIGCGHDGLDRSDTEGA